MKRRTLKQEIGLLLYWLCERFPCNRWNWLAWHMDVWSMQLISNCKPWWVDDAPIGVSLKRLGSEAAARKE